jgi:hypothetical protein
MEWLVETFPYIRPYDDSVFDEYDAVINACRYGHLDVLKWIYERFNVGEHRQIIRFDLNIYDTYFLHACEKGHLEVAQFLIEKFSHIHKFEVGLWTFIHSCRYTYIADLLYPTYYDPTKNIDSIFTQVCLYGWLDSAKWLASRFEINVAHKDYSCFRDACLKGHIQVVKWLVETFPELYFTFRAKNDDALTQASYFGFVEVVEYLIQLYNRKELEEVFQKISLHAPKKIQKLYLESMN